MNNNEIKKLFTGKFILGDSESKKVLILDNKIDEIKNNLKLNPNLKFLLLDLLIMKAIIELNDEQYNFETINKIYEIDNFNLKALILEMRVENWVYGTIREKTINKINNILSKNEEIDYRYLSILKYYEAFYNVELNNLNIGINFLEQSLKFWNKNSSSYRLYGYILKKMNILDKSKEMYMLEKSNKNYYKINRSDYNWSDFDLYLYIIAQNLEIIEDI
ncbi:hypothetical protein [uncultured Tyzzerella sp.]|uniref:hypothetical protein n=1 Tax=uncultured Tyzzerella sp. TaxID=2321398 RepID=UPI00294353D6|nr:hypothetical protein [uncultured Tyzzerella sp.]